MAHLCRTCKERERDLWLNDRQRTRGTTGESVLFASLGNDTNCVTDLSQLSCKLLLAVAVQRAPFRSANVGDKALRNEHLEVAVMQLSPSPESTELL